MVNAGESAATNIEPFAYLGVTSEFTKLPRLLAGTYPKAKLLQSAAGAIEHNGSKSVLADIDSDLKGSNKVTFPIASPINLQMQEQSACMYHLKL